MDTTSLGANLRVYTDRLEANGIKFGQGIYLAGGAIRRAICGHNIEEGDFDIYITNNWKFEESQKAYGWELVGSKERPTLKMMSYDFNIDNLRVQLHYLPEEMTLQSILETFDFTCCQFAYDGDKVHYLSAALEDTRNMRLRLTGTFGRFTVARSFRFLGMDFKATKSVLDELQKRAAAEVWFVPKEEKKGFS